MRGCRARGLRRWTWGPGPALRAGAVAAGVEGERGAAVTAVAPPAGVVEVTQRIGAIQAMNGRSRLLDSAD